MATFLRSFTHGHVQQLDAVASRLLAGLTGRVPALIAGADDPEGLAFIDVDGTVREVHGYAKQTAGFGYTGVRGLNVQLATVSTPLAAPVITRPGCGPGTPPHTPGGRILAQAITTARAAGVKGRILARADLAYYGPAFVGTAMRKGAWFSVTTRMNPQVKAAISSIDDAAWAPISYPNAVFDEVEERWISDAEGEQCRVHFPPQADHVTCRFIVRRVKRLQPLAGDGTGQGELFATYIVITV